MQIDKFGNDVGYDKRLKDIKICKIKTLEIQIFDFIKIISYNIHQVRGIHNETL